MKQKVEQTNRKLSLNSPQFRDAVPNTKQKSRESLSGSRVSGFDESNPEIKKYQGFARAPAYRAAHTAFVSV